MNQNADHNRVSKENETKTNQSENWDIEYIAVGLIRIFKIWSSPMSHNVQEIRNPEDSMALRFFSLVVVVWLSTLITPLSITDDTSAFKNPTVLAIALTGLIATFVKLLDGILKIKIGGHIFINIYTYMAITLAFSSFVFAYIDNCINVGGCNFISNNGFLKVAYGVSIALIFSCALLIIKSHFYDKVAFTKIWVKDLTIATVVTLSATILLLTGSYLPFVSS